MATSCEDSCRKGRESKKEFEGEHRMHLGWRKSLKVVEDMMKRTRHAFINLSLILAVGENSLNREREHR